MWRQYLRQGTSRLAAADRRWSDRVARQAESSAALYRGSTLLARAGDGAVCLLVGLLIYALGSPGHQSVLLQVAAAVLLTALVVAGLKFGVRRTRPKGPASARWSAWPNRDLYSFPSGHAARAACITASVAVLHPLAGVLFLLWTIGVCLARVAVAAHYLFDVLVGVLIGFVVAEVVGRIWPTLSSSILR
jgi:membrane-associated phospholipid phosphatase